MSWDHKGLETARTIADLRAVERGWRGGGHSIGLVPTMGGLHDGHLALVRRALQLCDRVVVSIFVNPRQFGSADDLARYPRREAEDCDKLAKAGAHLVFMPAVDEMYPPGSITTVSVTGALTQTLDAIHRRGHFDGVTTIVAKLFLQALPDVALFGEKDYQQLRIVTQMARDLDIPLRIEPVPTVRDPDGLALSSRNLNLSQDERRIASAFPAALFAAVERLVQGGEVEATLEEARNAVLAAGFDRIDYIELADAETLSPMRALGPTPARLFGAAFIGRTRLIDNMPLPS